MDITERRQKVITEKETEIRIEKMLPYTPIEGDTLNTYNHMLDKGPFQGSLRTSPFRTPSLGIWLPVSPWGSLHSCALPATQCLDNGVLNPFGCRGGGCPNPEAVTIIQGRVGTHGF